MKYRSQNTYTTTLGGICTIVHAIFCAILTFVALKRLILKENPNLTSYNTHRDYIENDRFNPFDMGMDLYFGVFGGKKKLNGTDVDPRFGSFRVLYKIP